jgi:hypothetical protein
MIIGGLAVAFSGTLRTNSTSHIVIGIAAVLYGSLFLMMIRSVRRRLRERFQSSRPDPIPDGVLEFYFSDDEALTSVAVQRGVHVGPVRRERTSRWVLKGATGKRLQLGGERGGEDKDVYELPGDISVLLRELAKKLRDAGELETELASIPSVEVDEGFDREKVEDILREGFERRQRQPMGKASTMSEMTLLLDSNVWAQAAEILADNLPQANLVAAKKAQFEVAKPGQYVLIESSWRLVETQHDGACLELTHLHSGGGTPDRRVETPPGISIRVRIGDVPLRGAGGVRWRNGIADAGIFGTIGTKDDTDGMLLVPLAVYARAPKVRNV